MRYFKGYNKNTDRHMFCIVYDEPQKNKFGLGKESYTVEYGYMDQSGRNYADIEDFKEEFYLAREIGKAEYDLYYNIQQLITEFYMNQITGGFPSQSTATFGRHLDHMIRKAYDEVNPKDISIADALADAFSTSLKNNMEVANE